MKDRLTRRRFLGKGLAGGLGLMVLPAIPFRGFGGSRAAYRERSFFTMGSVATVSAYGESHAHIDQAVNRLVAEFQRLDGLLSVFNPASEISRLNAAAGRSAVKLSGETIGLLRRALEINRRTKGAFDVTVEPLMKLWGFRGERRNIPTDAEIARTLESVGPHQLVFESAFEAGLKSEGACVDLGGIGVGYAVDRAVAVLRSVGIESAFVNHAGDAYALGAPEGEDGWIAVVPDPANPAGTLRAFSLKDRAVSTSAGSERNVTLDNLRFGHVMDVRSGRPEHRTLSMTVIASNALEADAFSTAAFCDAAVLASDSSISFLSVRENGNGGIRIDERFTKDE